MTSDLLHIVESTVSNKAFPANLFMVKLLFGAEFLKWAKRTLTSHVNLGFVGGGFLLKQLHKNFSK